MSASSIASTASVAENQLFWFLIWLCGLTAVLIIGLLIVFSIIYRQRPGRTQANMVHQKKVLFEVLWIGLPLATFLFLFWWGAKVYFQQMKIPSGGLQIYCVGQQWMWKFQHLEGQREINTIHVPVNQTVSLTMTSQDVIHSFFVPNFRIKMDVVPGRYTQTWFKATRPGTYRIFCSQYCGTWHARMTGFVMVMSKPEYQAWLLKDHTENMAIEGQKIVQEHGCMQCHSPHSRIPAPDFHGLFGSQVSLSNGETVPADELYIRDSILNPGKQIVQGYVNLMPTYEHQLSEEQINDIIEYIKSLSAIALSEKGQH